MNTSDLDKAFSGSIAQVYERYLVPLIFQPYADDLAERAARCKPGRVLETAAGTGVVTRQLARTLPPGVSLIATDLNQAMLDQASAVGTVRPVEFKQADAAKLPFPDESFDAVVCQFGAMFFPDKAKAFAEARRVLRPGGCLLFNVWDRIENNEVAAIVNDAVADLFPADPPRFLSRTPYGHFDLAALGKELARGGFAREAEMTTVTARGRAESPRSAAIAFCQGTPLRSEIETRGPSRLEEATDVAARALEKRFGSGAVDGKMQAHVIVQVR